MPRIVETIVTTTNAKGEAHIAPLGLIADGENWIIAPFRPSRTLDNLREVPFAVASHTDDVRVFAGCVTGRKSWPTRPADEGRRRGARRRGLALGARGRPRRPRTTQRPRFSCRLVHAASHRPWEGFNRAQAAVLECAVLVTRLEDAAAGEDRGRAQVSRDRRSPRRRARASRKPGAG